MDMLTALDLESYHSCVEVNGREYAFGAHNVPNMKSGIAEAEAGHNNFYGSFTLRKSILIGWNDLDTKEKAREVIGELSKKYRVDAYNLITNNCNHFCNDACIQLTGNPIPNWVNRLARIGLFCRCILPMRLKSTINVQHRKIENSGEEEETQNRLK